MNSDRLPFRNRSSGIPVPFDITNCDHQTKVDITRRMQGYIHGQENLLGKNTKKTVEIIKHDEASRSNIPTAEYQSLLREDAKSPIRSR